jgi:hypothetical protein
VVLKDENPRFSMMIEFNLEIGNTELTSDIRDIFRKELMEYGAVAV